MKPQKKDGIAPAALCADQTFIKNGKMEMKEFSKDQ